MANHLRQVALREKDEIKSKTLSVRLKPSVASLVAQEARDIGVSVNELIGRTIESASRLPSWAEQGCGALLEFVRSDAASAAIRRSIGEHLQSDEHGAKVQLDLMSTNIELVNVAMWRRTSEFAFSWRLKDVAVELRYGPTLKTGVLSAAGDLVLAPSCALSVTNLSCEFRSESATRIDDDLPF